MNFRGMMMRKTGQTTKTKRNHLKGRFIDQFTEDAGAPPKKG